LGTPEIANKYIILMEMATRGQTDLQVDDEGVEDLGEETFFKFNVIYLLEINNLRLLKGFKCNRLPIQKRQIHFSEGTSANHPQQVVIRDAPLVVFHEPPYHQSVGCS